MTTAVFLLVAALLVVATALYVLWPLLGASAGDVDELPEAAGDPAREDQRETALAALRDVELEYRLGNLTAADYRWLRERYYRGALAALRGSPRGETLDGELEREIAALRVETRNE